MTPRTRSTLRSALVAALSLAASRAALAETYTILTEGDGSRQWLIEPGAAGTITETGVGNPAVAYDSVNGQYVMFFETRLSDAYLANPPAGSGVGANNYAGCLTNAGGSQVFAIGYATSADGLAWTVQGEAFLPKTGTYYSCVAAQPAVVFEDGVWHLWFKSGQERDVAGTTPGWCPNDGVTVCDQKNSGFGYATGTDLTALVASALPAYQRSDAPDQIGFPKVTKVGDTWYMAYTISPRIRIVTAPEAAGPWTLRNEIQLQEGAADWMRDRVYNGALTCEDNTLLNPLTMFFGGKQLNGSAAADVSGWGRATSPWFPGAPDQLEDFFIASGSPFFLWSTANGNAAELWQHWDVLRIGDQYVVYYAGREGNTLNRIGVAYSGVSTDWNEALISNRVCRPVPDTDTDTDTTDTDTDTTDTDTDTTDTDTDTGDTDTDTGDTDTDTTDTDTDTQDTDTDTQDPDTDTDTQDPDTDTDTDTGTTGGGCNCSSAGGTPAGLLLFAPLALVARRRRR
jgi:MYXO-CTERM domain-containing protein